MKTQAVVAGVAPLSAALVLAVACWPETTERVKGDRETCEIYCARFIECKDPNVASSEAACVDGCVESADWSGACADELAAFMECATLPENACPTFEFVGLRGGEAAPCYDENFDHSICVNMEASR
jgi:hypothetical protein